MCFRLSKFLRKESSQFLRVSERQAEVVSGVEPKEQPLLVPGKISNHGNHGGFVDLERKSWTATRVFGSRQMGKWWPMRRSLKLISHSC